MSDVERGWVWWADTDSVRAGKLSVLACAETVVMVVLYWVIAVVWDTHLHLLAGVLVMPLMLFRSDESVALGVRWGKKIEDTYISRLDTKRAVENWVGCVGFCCSIALLFTTFSGLSSILVWLIALAFSIVSLLHWRIVEMTIRFLKWRFLIVSLSGVGSLIIVPLHFAFFYLAPTFIRVLSCKWNLRSGFLNIGENWTRILFASDTVLKPEPLPDPNRDVVLWDIVGHIEPLTRIFANPSHKANYEHVLRDLIATIMLSPVFLSVVVFRWTLKSTIWFYFIFVVLTHPYHLQNTMAWMRSFSGTLHTRFRVLVSVIFIAVAFGTLIGWDAKAACGGLQLGQQKDLPIIPLSVFLVLDWQNLEPWHFASLPEWAVQGLGWFAGPQTCAPLASSPA